jgi:hypothetical protein
MLLLDSLDNAWLEKKRNQITIKTPFYNFKISKLKPTTLYINLCLQVVVGVVPPVVVDSGGVVVPGGVVVVPEKGGASFEVLTESNTLLRYHKLYFLLPHVGMLYQDKNISIT